MLFIYFYIWVCVALCLLEFACVPRMVHMSGKGPVVKGWQWCHTSFALNEYLIKTLPFKSLSKALVLQSFQIQCSSWWWGAKQSVLFADCCLFLYSLFFFSFFPSSHPFPLPCISLSLFFLCSLFVNVSILQENTFYVLSDGRLCFLSLRENKWFAAFHCHYCCH